MQDTRKNYINCTLESLRSTINQAASQTILLTIWWWDNGEEPWKLDGTKQKHLKCLEGDLIVTKERRRWWAWQTIFLASSSCTDWMGLESALPGPPFTVFRPVSHLNSFTNCSGNWPTARPTKNQSHDQQMHFREIAYNVDFFRGRPLRVPLHRHKNRCTIQAVPLLTLLDRSKDWSTTGPVCSRVE